MPRGPRGEKRPADVIAWLANNKRDYNEKITPR
jgi:hypothetical protein